MIHTVLKTAAAVAIAALPLAANAAVLTDLYNTGLTASGGALGAGNGQSDGNYVVTPGTIGAAGPAVTYYNTAYAAENAGSRWISYASNGGSAAGNFTLSTTFDLTGYDISTASISGLWGVDNDGEIFLNGVSTGIILGGGDNQANFNILHAFSITSGFVSGVNTLSFAVTDLGQPAALRVDSIVGEAALVPEPATWGLMIVGFGLVGIAARRRKVVFAA